MGFVKVTAYGMTHLIFRANRTENPARGYRVISYMNRLA